MTHCELCGNPLRRSRKKGEDPQNGSGEPFTDRRAKRRLRGKTTCHIGPVDYQYGKLDKRKEEFNMGKTGLLVSTMALAVIFALFGCGGSDSGDASLSGVWSGAQTRVDDGT